MRNPASYDPDEIDPIIKTDGSGRPVRASQLGMNRAARRRLVREARRRKKRDR